MKKIVMCMLFVMSTTAAFGGTVKNLVNEVLLGMMNNPAASRRQLQTLLPYQSVYQLIILGEDLNEKGAMDITLLIMLMSMLKIKEVLRL